MIINFLFTFRCNYTLYLLKFKCYLLKSLAIGFIIIQFYNLQQFKRTFFMIIVDQDKRSFDTSSIQHLMFKFINMIHIFICYVLTSLQRVTWNFNLLNPFNFSLFFYKLNSYIAVYLSLFQYFEFESKHFGSSFE